MILVACFVAGLALGGLFFGGLWVTVRQIVKTANPVALTLGSLVVRTAVVLAGFVFVTNGRWQNAVACLVGFTVARVVVSRVLPACT